MRPNNNDLNFGTIAAPSLSVSTGANQSSTAQYATDIVRVSFQVVITGSVEGEIQVQASLDKPIGAPINQFQPTNWGNVGPAITANAAGVYIIPSLECGYSFIRLSFFDGSGGTSTGSLVARIESKSL